jgi:hypothetical protein
MGRRSAARSMRKRRTPGQNIATTETIANAHIVIAAPIQGPETIYMFEHNLPSRDADAIHVRYPTCLADISEHKYLVLDGKTNFRQNLGS